jgi:nucleoside-diphosphate-sugar epimerase
VYSKGQLPAVFTRYKSATTWGGNRFDNTKLRGLGWRPIVSTPDGLDRAFQDLKTRAALAS